MSKYKFKSAYRRLEPSRKVAAPLLKVLQHSVRIPLALSLLCLTALPVAGQDKPAELPTVTAFKCPKYPALAESMRLQGVVIMQVTTDGHQVADVKLTSGHPALAPEAIKNVRTWMFADHAPTTFKVTYYYLLGSHYKRDRVTKCDAMMDLPTTVHVAEEMPLLH